MTEYQEILNGLTTEQEAVCTIENDTYLTACPGSGKTLVLTRRLAYLALSNPQSRKWNIAITYTNRAADEIADRLDSLGVNQSNIWTGTIHQFCMQFIIRPYAMYSARLSKGYTIIDEYIQREYGKEIAKELGITLNLYDDPFKCPEIKVVYLARLETNKEIDFDQILQFSDELVSTKDFICSNIATIINSVLVDEFQDTNELQYKILAQICKKNKAISLLFVGDVNQAIFDALGGVAKGKDDMDSLFDTTFEEKSLTGCYRSTQNVVDLYTEFEIATTGVTSVAAIKDNQGKLSHDVTVSKDKLSECIAAILTAELAAGIPETEICVVAPQWLHLFQLSSDLKKQLPDISFDASDISPFKYDPMNPFYLLARLVFTESGQNVAVRKRVATELLTILRDDYKVAIPDNVDNYDVLRTINISTNVKEDGIVILENAIQSVLRLFKIQMFNESRLHKIHERFFEKTQDRISRHSIATDYQSISTFFKERRGIVLSTIHGVKGEEYSIVIAFSLLNGRLPHWDYIMNDGMKPKRLNETQKLLYVLCSRAKRSIYLFSERGYKTQSGNEYTPTDELTAGFQRFETKRQTGQ
jgi:superfamily I DNA/RNA helicase